MKNKKVYSKVITLIFLSIFLWYGFSNKHIFADLAGISLISLGLIALGRFIVYFSNGLFTKWSVELFTKKISLGEGVYVGILSAIGNFFGPLLGGAGIRAVYLKKIHNLSYSHFTSTLMGHYLILFTLNCIISIGALLALESTSQTNILLAFFGGWLVFMLVFTRLHIPKNRLDKHVSNKLVSRIYNILLQIEQGWRHILSNKKLLIKLSLIALLSYFGSLFMFWFEFKAVGIEIFMPTLLLYTSFVTISILISITPGAIGIRETILLVTAATMGITVPQILQLAVIDRGVNFALLIILFILMRNNRIKKALTGRELDL